MAWFWNRFNQEDGESSSYEEVTGSEEEEEEEENEEEEGVEEEGEQEENEAHNSTAGKPLLEPISFDRSNEVNGNVQIDSAKKSRQFSPENSQSDSCLDNLHDEDEEDEDDSSQDEHLLKGVFPGDVEVNGSPIGRCIRADSVLSMNTDADVNDEDHIDDEVNQNKGRNHQSLSITPSCESSASVDRTSKDDIEEEEEVTSNAEKLSLLALAAEHDRVDILQAILAEENSDRDDLLSCDIPPLHIAVSFGSVNAVNFLLRKGADPSLRPNVAEIVMKLAADDSTGCIEIAKMNRFDDISAWELAFGDSNSEPATSICVNPDKRVNKMIVRRRKTKIQAMSNIAPSKREGIRHAFTAEALRCIGSDEVSRLKQLIEAGMPSTIDIGGRNLCEWCVDMNAAMCKDLLFLADSTASYELHDTSSNTENTQAASSKRGSSVLDKRGGEPQSLSQMSNRLNELESLSKALSISLDGLAEEVSVCNGLLLMGGGASALATHVRSLKSNIKERFDELKRMQEAWQNSEDELAYWVRQCGPDAVPMADSLMVPADEILCQSSRFINAASSDNKDAQKKQLEAQVAASEHKIRKLRASIGDLSEVLSRDLLEVKKRGLSGGIKLVRGLREQIREIEFKLSEARSGDGTCRTKIRMIQGKMQTAQKPNHPKSFLQIETCDHSLPSLDVKSTDEVPVLAHENGNKTVPMPPTETTVTGYLNSNQIEMGRSTAIAIRHGDGQGYFPLSLWHILLRIIGFGHDTSTRSDPSSQAIII